MTVVRIAPGAGLVVRRPTALVFVPDPAGADDLIAAFRDATDGDALDAVTMHADERELAVPEFVVVEWAGPVRLAVFGALQVTSDQRSMPSLSAAGSATWVERTLRAEVVTIAAGASAVHTASDIRLGTVPADGFTLTLGDPSATEPQHAVTDLPVAKPPDEQIGSTGSTIGPLGEPDARPTGPRDEPTIDVPEHFPFATRPRWSLRFEDGSVEHVDGALVLGRNPTLDPPTGALGHVPTRLVQIECPQMSARHLSVWADDVGLWVRDLRSRNRSWVVTSGDHRLVALEPDTPMRLEHGTHVQIGTKVFVVERAADA